MTESSHGPAQLRILRMSSRTANNGLQNPGSGSSPERDMLAISNLEPYIDAVEAARFAFFVSIRKR